MHELHKVKESKTEKEQQNVDENCAGRESELRQNNLV